MGDLYTGGIVWATRLNQNPDSTLADALRFASSLAAAVPQGCSTAALAGIGSRISNVQATGVWPFYIRPGALLVVLVDTGPRPVPLASCPEASSFGATPAGWARFAGGPLDRYATRFAFATTNETESLDQLRTDRRSLSDQHQCFDVGEPLGQDVDVVDVVVPHRDVVVGQPVEARQRPERVEPVIEDRDPHAVTLIALLAATFGHMLSDAEKRLRFYIR